MNIFDAKRIIKKHQRKIPVQVVKIAKALGAEVRTTTNWDDNLSGKILKRRMRNGKIGYVIFVNGNHHPNRQRFTIAHEIAHIVLHKNLIGNGIVTDGLYRSGLSNTIEWSANKFAGDMLMPSERVIELLDEGVDSIDELANEFQVSRAAMSIQMDWAWAWRMKWDSGEDSIKD
ncbi:MAG: ImmA/IrrE family metallo-endopeptidase [Caldilineaceae bacterium]|nr:ImmA/IrrE family metallo-endopeptidase [Caldilineaceae bacterium]